MLYVNQLFLVLTQLRMGTVSSPLLTHPIFSSLHHFSPSLLLLPLASSCSSSLHLALLSSVPSRYWFSFFFHSLSLSIFFFFSLSLPLLLLIPSPSLLHLLCSLFLSLLSIHLYMYLIFTSCHSFLYQFSLFSPFLRFLFPSFTISFNHFGLILLLLLLLLLLSYCCAHPILLSFFLSPSLSLSPFSSQKAAVDIMNTKSQRQCYDASMDLFLPGSQCWTSSSAGRRKGTIDCE